VSCFEVRFRTSRPIDADWFDEQITPATFKRPLRFWRPHGTARDENWLAIESRGYATYQEAENIGERVQDALLMSAAKRKMGVEFTGRGAISGLSVFTGGQFDVADPGTPLPAPLTRKELIEIVTTLESNLVLTPNQRVAAELLNDSFFEMSPEARFLLRVSAVEAMCPQAGQTEAVRDQVARVLRSIPSDASGQIKEALERIAKRQTVRSAYMSKIKHLLGNDEAKRFDALYGRRSDLLHDGAGRGVLGEAANAALDICWKLLSAEVR
jgi:hypothetical protein